MADDKDPERKAALAAAAGVGAQALQSTMPDIIQSIAKIAHTLTGKSHGVLVVVWSGDGTAPFATNADKDTALQVIRDTYSAIKGQVPQASEPKIIIAGANDPIGGKQPS